MNIWKKTLSVGLSLALCAGMVMPAFAASFADLQGAINGAGDADENSFTAEDGSTRYGYGAKSEETGKYEIEAWNGTRDVLDSEGKETGETADTRHVRLNGEVKRQDDEVEEDRYGRVMGVSITIADGADVTLDLNGNNVDANQSKRKSVITIEQGGELTLTDSAAFTYIDEDGSEKYQSGAVTGSSNGTSYYAYGGGVYNDHGTFTMNGGAIRGNTGSYQGGGVYNKGGTFTMNGGEISGNTANYQGGGVYNQGTFTLNGGAISGNIADGYGSGVFNYYCRFTMNGGEISGNTAEYAGGGVSSQGSVVTMNGGKITGNTASKYGGGVYSDYSRFTMNGGEISGNTAGTAGDEIHLGDTYYHKKVVCNFPEDSLWESDFAGDRADPSSVQVYTGAQVSSEHTGSWNLDLKRHEHKFTQEEITATCTEAGQKISSGCACGRTVTEEIDPLGHDMTGEWYETKKAQPGVAGEERRDCQREGCDHFETRPTEALPKEPDSGSGGGNGGGNPTNPTDPTNPTNPTNPTDPTVEVDEPDVPLGELPEGDGDPVEIDEPETPLDGQPEGIDPADAADPTEGTDPTVELDDPDVPLSGVPQTGEASAAMWLAVLLACGLGLVYVNTGKRKENA